MNKSYSPKKTKKNSSEFPVVAIGASAGGLDAFLELLKNIPNESGMAFVFIQHLDPEHKSLLTQALKSKTKMRVSEIKDATQLQKNQVYVIPPGHDLFLQHNHFKLRPRLRVLGKQHMPIDDFFRSLAISKAEKAIGVILSGSATDGTEGLRAIKEAGGFTFAQDPKTAKYSGMPDSAIKSKVVDICLDIPGIVSEILRLGSNATVEATNKNYSSNSDENNFNRILLTVKDALGIDFSEYKAATTKRRLARRMAILKIVSYAEYLNFLEANKDESKIFYEDVLIHVTSFFRDPEAFSSIKENVYPEIFKNKQDSASVRVWAAGCSSGEEVYSLVISLLEYLGDQAEKFNIQVFGTDVSEIMVDRARLGFFNDSAIRELSAERKKRFFVKVDGGYRVAKKVRDLCIFVKHDLSKDPPFSRIDLISCRNVLIYFDQSLQKKILSTFHYCLNQPGFLLLGRAEGVTNQPLLFSVANKENKIFSRVIAPNHVRMPSLSSLNSLPKSITLRPSVQSTAQEEQTKKVDRILLSEFSPSGVLVNERMDILQFRGNTADYLEQGSGPPETNLLKLIKQGLFVELQIAFTKAKRDGITVRRRDLRIGAGKKIRKCNLVIYPIESVSTHKDRLYLILFENGEEISLYKATAKRKKLTKKEEKMELQRSKTLEYELSATKKFLQSINEEHQKANEALMVANEEFVSSNEELQSMNEELETAKEELQSSNEELTTLNDEMQSRSLEVSQVNSDLVNLLNSVEIPIVILDVKHRIRRFTINAKSIMNLLPSDVGRPINDIRTNVTINDLDNQISDVIERNIVKEFEVQDRDGKWYRLQIRPYKTIEKKIDGVVLSLVDINVLRRAVGKAEWARDYSKGIVEGIQFPLLVFDNNSIVISANKAFYDLFSLSKERTENRSLSEIGMNRWYLDALGATLGDILAKKVQFQNIEVERDFLNFGKKTLSLSVRSIHSDLDIPNMILLSMEDITDRKVDERERSEFLKQTQVAKAEAEEANRAKDLFLATLSHELRTPLTSLILQAQLLRKGSLDAAKVLRASLVIENAAKMQAQLIEDLLDISRIVTGKLKMEQKIVDLSAVISEALHATEALSQGKSITILTNLDQGVGKIFGDPIRLQQVVCNLVTNAIKFSPSGSKINIDLKTHNSCAQIQVIDEGMGIEREFLPNIFTRFSQEESSIRRIHGGLGLGLAIVKHIVEMHSGEVSVMSLGKNKGATFTVSIPLLNNEKNNCDEEENDLNPVQKNRKGSGLQGRKILIIDDDSGTREALDDLLKQAGADVRIASSAEEGMRILLEFKPDEIVCDIAMPDEDGYTFLRKVRKLDVDSGGETPALALTALAGERDRQQAFLAGFQMHLSKPVDFSKLADALERLGEVPYTVH
jgi:two-component system CheB/CheR fusion protein